MVNVDRELDLLIVGGGLAGLTAAMFAGRLGLQPVLLMDYAIGGQILNIEKIADYPGFPDGVAGYDLGPAVQQQAEDAGAEIAMDEAVRVEAGQERHTVETMGGEVFRPRALILALGSSLRKLGVPGEAEFEGRGVSTCASCDAPLFAGKRVLVVGGGDSALLESLTLAEHGVDVLIAHRGGRLSGQQTLQDAVAARADITVRFNTQLMAIHGDTTVNRVDLRCDGQPVSEEVAGVFVYAGLDPKSQLLEGVVPLDGGGHVQVNAWLETAVPGIFAAGDIRQHFSGQLVSAAGDGATAGVAAHRYLRSTGSRA